MIHLVNGTKQARVKNSEGCTVLPCNCAHEEIMWLQLCDEHYEEWARERRDAFLAHRAHYPTEKVA